MMVMVAENGDGSDSREDFVDISRLFGETR